RFVVGRLDIYRRRCHWESHSTAVEAFGCVRLGALRTFVEREDFRSARRNERRWFCARHPSFARDRDRSLEGLGFLRRRAFAPTSWLRSWCYRLAKRRSRV